MAAWVISIVGVICLGVLLDILLPDGQTAKYVKGVYSLLIVFVIIAPLQKIADGEFKISLENTDIAVNGDALHSFSKWRGETSAANLEGYLADNDYSAKAEVIYADGSVSEIVEVNIILSAVSSDEDEANKIFAEVSELTCGYLGVESDIVSVGAEP